MLGKHTLVCIGFLLSMVPFTLHADDIDPHKSTDTSVGRESQDVPSMELLEFLGYWETENGKWIDPTELDRMTMPPQEEDGDEQKNR